MSKKNFIELADAIREMYGPMEALLGKKKADDAMHIVIADMADFCRSQNSAFMRERWIGYIKGENGANGGAVPKTSAA